MKPMAHRERVEVLAPRIELALFPILLLVTLVFLSLLSLLMPGGVR